jgi:hypothetical protein
MTVEAPARWEWRVFGDGFPVLHAWLATTPHDIRHSDETYLLGPRRDLNVKLRGGVLDIKQRLARDRGLELWRPVSKQPFPLDGAAIASLFRLWDRPAPALSRPAYTADALLGEVISAEPHVRVVHVAKQRRTGACDGCLVELADLAVDGRLVQTAAVESVDPAAVLRLARALGLDGRDNLNYVEALRRLLPAQAT